MWDKMNPTVQKCLMFDCTLKQGRRPLKFPFYIFMFPQIWDMSDDESIWGLNPRKQRKRRPRSWNLGTETHTPDGAHYWRGPTLRPLKPERTCLTSSWSIFQFDRHFITPSLTINTFVGLSQGSGGKVWVEIWQHLNTSLPGGCSRC